MPFYFKQSKLPSFQRQLNLYGFQRLTKGPDKGGYYHELFLRGKIFLAERIRRMRIKGNGVRAKSNPEAEPNFQLMPPVTVSSRVLVEVMNEDPQICLKIGESAFEESQAQLKKIQVSQTKQEPVIHRKFGGMNFPQLEDLNASEHDTGCAVVSDSQILLPFLQHLNFSLDLYSDIVKSVETDNDYADLILRLIQ
jgi:HSF-type DNA-binding